MAEGVSLVRHDQYGLDSGIVFVVIPLWNVRLLIDFYMRHSG